MATLKQRLHRKNSSGTYDVVHLETSASCVNMDSGVTVEAKIATMDTTIAGKAPSSHGTHVTWSTTTPKMNGTAAVGTETKVARGDHVHPVDTSRAAASHNHAASAITSGTLAVARGGTGVTANPSLLVNLASTSAASVFAASPRPGVTGTLPVARGGTGVTSLDALKTALGITDTSTPSSGSSVVVGGTISFGDYDWICVHNDTTNGIKYMMTKYVIGATVFGNSTVFASSQALLFCRLLEAAFGLAGNDDFVEFTNDSVTGKLLLATYAQCNGGFSYFSSNANRIGTDANGTATTWWTSSPAGSSYVYYVYADGGLFNYYGPSNAYGFRPCVALKV